jgi:MFS family permease
MPEEVFVVIDPALADLWPLYSLIISTARLELHLPREEELAALAHLAGKGVHGPDERPFLTPWTEGLAEDRSRFVLQEHWSQLGQWTVASWQLGLGVFRQGEPVGIVTLRARDFPVVREVTTSSWLGLGGGLVYAVVGRRRTPLMRHALLGLLFGGPAVFFIFARSPWAVGVILVIGGLAVTPFYINSYLMIDADIASSVRHEANSWVPVGNDVGYIVGISVAGLLVPRVGLPAAMWVAGLFGATLLLLSARSLARQRTSAAVPSEKASEGAVG